VVWCLQLACIALFVTACHVVASSAAHIALKILTPCRHSLVRDCRLLKSGCWQVNASPRTQVFYKSARLAWELSKADDDTSTFSCRQDLLVAVTFRRAGVAWSAVTTGALQVQQRGPLSSSSRGCTTQRRLQRQRLSPSEQRQWLQDACASDGRFRLPP
jgi:hypothetical protein